MAPQPLTRAQRTVAKVVLAALADDGFCLAGGAGLVVSGMSDRPTRDIDAFTDHEVDMVAVAAATTKALEAAGFKVTVERSYPTFASLLVTAGELRRSQFKVDLARDHREWPPVTTSLGPTLSQRELAANKALAVFGRVQPRDLVDLARLAEVLDLDEVFADAKTKDPGFNRPVLAEMIGLILRRPDSEWPPGVDVAAVRRFGRQLLRRLDEPAS
jgi:hypothetical protein